MIKQLTLLLSIGFAWGKLSPSGTMTLDTNQGSIEENHDFKKHKFSIGFLPTASFTMEYDITKWAQAKLGGMAMILLGGTVDEDGGNAGILPFLGLNFLF